MEARVACIINVVTRGVASDGEREPIVKYPKCALKIPGIVKKINDIVKNTPY